MVKKVSIVIPAKNSGVHIASCVDSLLKQTYDNIEIIVVAGGANDNTWAALSHFKDWRIKRIQTRASVTANTRDSNYKRSVGLQVATGDVIAMTDSDMVLPVDWVERGILLTELYPVVGSGMISEAVGFMGEYVDGNKLGSRTPRLAQEYVLDASNFGKPGRKPPITANLFMLREVFEKVGPPDATFTRSFEDYEWARRIVDSGYQIFCTGDLSGYHSHRVDLRRFFHDYHRAGRGCADYMLKYKNCYMTKTRWAMLFTIPALLILAVVLLVTVTLPTFLVILALTLGVMMLSSIASKDLQALFYPFVTAVAAMSYWAGMVHGLLVKNRNKVEEIEKYKEVQHFV